jgi:uncharacterized protein
MSPSKKIGVLVVSCFLVIFAFGQESYADKLKEHRAKINEKMMDSASSPLREERKNYTGLNYFDANETYLVKAKFKKEIGPEFNMATSSGEVRKYKKYGTLTFKLNGKKRVLTCYQNLSLITNPIYKNYLFLPFTDNTNGYETYETGRYIDFSIPKSKHVYIDFNLAYNPYCAYSEGYSCPIPPTENYLETRVEAGEKKYKP